MERRNVLFAGASGIMALLSGCTGGTDDGKTDGDEDDGTNSGNEKSDPVQTVESFVEAVDTGNKDKANSFLHNYTVEPDPENEIQLEDAELVTQNESSAVVAVTQTAAAGNVSTTIEGEYHLKKIDGEWRIKEDPWSLEMGDLSIDIPDVGFPDDLEIVRSKLIRENEGEYSESVMVTGTVKNTGDGTVASAVLTVDFLNEDGQVVDESSALVEEIEPDETQKFEVESFLMGEDAAAVTDHEITIK